MILFVIGVHRSGTSALKKWLQSHDEISGHINTGKPEDEGMFLQEQAYNSGLEFPGLFACRKSCWLTEKDVTPAIAKHLRESWEAHWDLSKPVLLEKSPPHITKTRFLHKIFPDSKFLVVKRNPLAVLHSTMKMQKDWNGVIPEEVILSNWCNAYNILMEDMDYVGGKKYLTVKYENMQNDLTRQAISNFIGLKLSKPDWVLSEQYKTKDYSKFISPSIAKKVDRLGYKI